MAQIDDAAKSLERMQEFDPKSLVREVDLGGVKNFRSAVEPAQRLIDLYKRLTINALQDFPAEQLSQVQTRANSDYQLFDQVLKFDPDFTTQQRDELIRQITNAYAVTFGVLYPLIAYSLHRAADFQRLDADARATIQGINDKADAAVKHIEGVRISVDDVLAKVRATAAETGVTQQAYFFKTSAESHATEAEGWRKATNRLALATGLFAVLSLFLHRLPWIAPENNFDNVQLIVSKVLIFGVLSFVLFLAARSYLAQKHNAIVNRHRQEALQTYQALVDAAGDGANRDIILTHAAACIFGPQPTGYGQESSRNTPSAKSVVELLGSNVATGHGAG